MTEMRALIREIIFEEFGETLSNLKGLSREQVSIKTDSDLNDFAKRILELSRDNEVASSILSGSYLFTLSNTVSPDIRTSQSISQPVMSSANASQVAASPDPFEISEGLITERDVEKLPAGTRSLVVSEAVRLTPLARDEIGRLKITLERTDA